MPKSVEQADKKLDRLMSELYGRTVKAKKHYKTGKIKEAKAK
jgi:hypothetical protein